MIKKYRKILHIVVFLIGVLIILFAIHSFFKIPDKRVYQMTTGFYEEPPESLDAVIIGASNVYASWQAPFAWGRRGIKVYAYSVPGMPARAVPYIFEEVKKTQPDTLYIICLNNFKFDELDYSVAHIHYLTDYMPASDNRNALLQDLLQDIDARDYDKSEFDFPFLRFHSSWNELRKKHLVFSNNGLKGASTYNAFYQKVNNKGSKFKLETDSMDLEPEVEKELNSLLDYCKTSAANILFVINPQVIEKEQQMRLNRIAEYVERAGYPVFNMQPLFYEIGLDAKYDYYNSRHTNSHGSYKYTLFLADYLKETYGFDDKRDNGSDDSWDAAYENYMQLLSPFLLDFEITEQERDYSMTVPEIEACEALEDGSRAIRWSASPGAEEYLIYRKYIDPATGDKTKNECIATVDREQLEYIDDASLQTTIIWYTVVPKKTEGGTEYFGAYDTMGFKLLLES